MTPLVVKLLDAVAEPLECEAAERLLCGVRPQPCLPRGQTAACTTQHAERRVLP